MTEIPVTPDAAKYEGLAIKMIQMWAGVDDKDGQKALEGEGLQALDKLGITPRMYEGQKFDQKNVYPWFFGQVYAAIKEGRADIAIDMLNVNYSAHFLTEHFVGKDVVGIIETAKERNKRIEKQYLADFSESKGFANLGENPHRMLTDFGEIDRKKCQGREVSFLKDPDYPDMEATVVKGKLLYEGHSALFYVETPEGKKVEVNINNVQKTRIKDESDPPLHKMTARLKEDGFVELKDVKTINAGDELVWVAPNKDKMVWEYKRSKMLKTRDVYTGYAFFDVQTLDGQQTWSFNDIKSHDKVGLYVKHK